MTWSVVQFDANNSWYIKNSRTGRKVRIGPVMGKRTNYYDKAVAEANRRNEIERFNSFRAPGVGILSQTFGLDRKVATRLNKVLKTPMYWLSQSEFWNWFPKAGRKLSDKGQFLSPGDVVMEVADEALNGFGVEALIHHKKGVVALYVNLGDTYKTTIVFNKVMDTIHIMSWGDFVETRERIWGNFDG